MADFEVTDEMVKAGAKALSNCDSGFWSRGGTSEKELLTAIFLAMDEASPGFFQSMFHSGNSQ
jgi:hypothetical protein